MAKKEYKATDYDMMLSWAMHEYMPTESKEYGNCVRMNLTEGIGKERRGTAWVQIADGGLLIFRFETALSQQAEKDLNVYILLNRLNALRGITLYIDWDAFGAKLCARQEIYMDHFTMAAAKRAALRIAVAATDVDCVLKTLCEEMKEYFGEEALVRAEAERTKEMEEWDDGSCFEQEDSEEISADEEFIFADDDEELPF